MIMYAYSTSTITTDAHQEQCYLIHPSKKNKKAFSQNIKP